MENILLNMENMLLNNELNNLKNYYKNIEGIEFLSFKKEQDGVKKVNDKEYDIEISSVKGLTQKLIVTPSSLFILKSDYDSIVNIEDITIIHPSQAYNKILMVKCVNRIRSIYSIVGYYQLSSNDKIRVLLDKEIENPSFHITNIVNIMI